MMIRVDFLQPNEVDQCQVAEEGMVNRRCAQIPGVFLERICRSLEPRQEHRLSRGRWARPENAWRLAAWYEASTSQHGPEQKPADQRAEETRRGYRGNPTAQHIPVYFICQRYMFSDLSRRPFVRSPGLVPAAGRHCPCRGEKALHCLAMSIEGGTEISHVMNPAVVITGRIVATLTKMRLQSFCVEAVRWRCRLQSH